MPSHPNTSNGENPSWLKRVWPRALLIVPLVVIGTVAYRLLIPPMVDVVQPTRGPAVQAVYATGTVEPTVMIPIGARSTARLVALLVDEGSKVTEGQELARLEDSDLRRAVEEAAAEERFAKAEMNRQSKLVAEKVVARAAYDRARTNWQKAQAAVARVTAQASYLTLVAPADGVVIRRDGEVGQIIAANQTVFWLSCCAPLRITAEVDEEDIAQVTPGQEVMIRADAFPGQVFKGRVHEITPKGDPVARSYRVRVTLEQATPEQATPLLIGMTAETNIVLRKADNALLLPASAVADNKVWLVADGHLSQRAVVLGAKSAALVEVRDGVAAADWVVAAPQPEFKAGDRVRSAPQKTP